MKKIGKILFVLFLLAITSMSCFALVACESTYTTEEMDGLISQLQQNVDKNKTDFDSKIAKLEQEREVIEAELNSKIAELEQEREAIETELNSKIAELEQNYKAKDAQLKALIETNEQAISTLRTTYEAAVAELIENGEDNAKAIADLENEYRAKVEELQNNIDGALQEIQSNKTSLEKAVSDLRAEYEESLGELEDKLTELEEMVGEVEEKLGDGKIIQSVDFDADGNLEITFTDGTTQTVEVPQKHEHSFGEWITFTQDESINCEKRLFYHICADCGGVEWRIGNESDHNFAEEYSYNGSLHWFDCLNCAEEIEHAEHIFDEGENCTVCRQLIAPTEGVQYSLSSSGDFYEVVGYDGSAKNVVVADTYNDLPVRVIKANAFSSAEVKAVKIPNSVTSIEQGALSDRSRLEKMIIPFAGAANGGTSNVHFGYIFGASDYSENPYYVPSSLKSVMVTSATSIGDNAFYGCGGLTTITIPESVTSIGEYAFYKCSRLTKVNYTGTIDGWAQIRFGSSSANPIYYSKSLYINDIKVTEVHISTATQISNYAFYGCSSLTSIIIPESVTSIGADAFDGCSSISKVNYTGTIDSWAQISFGFGYSNPTFYAKSLYINDIKVTEVEISTATKISAYAFYGCRSLESITIPASVTSIGSYAFNGCRNLTSIAIPDGVTSIGDYTFSGCSSLESITIPDSILSIGRYAFYGCSGLESITIPDSVTSIGDYAFYNCSNLTSVIIGNSVTSIGDYAFFGCSSLESITIGKSVISIGDYTFSGCSNLTTVNYTGTIDSWVQISFGDYSANPIYYAKSLYINDIKVTEVEISTATKISAYAFDGCSSLESITIGNSVTSIGPWAFSGCSSLTSVIIPDSVTSIGWDAFKYCSSLTSITIPDSVTSIESSAFYGCSSLTSVTIGDSVTSIGSNAFYNCSSLTEIRYNGTVERWNDIRKELDWGRSSVIKKVVCIDGEINL